jgi:hypothetical protein
MHLLLHSFAHSINIHWPSIQQVLSSVVEDEGGIPLSTLSLDEKRALRAFLSSLRNPSDDEVVTLMSLPIFEAVDGTVTSLMPVGTITGRKLDVAPPRLSLPGLYCFFAISPSSALSPLSRWKNKSLQVKV